MTKTESNPRSAIWTLSDGGMGNRRQADALAAALGGGFEHIGLTPRAPWSWLAPRRFPGAAAAFGRVFRAQLKAQAPKLAIGCGRQAALATRMLRGRGDPPCRGVQILDPRRPSKHWDAVIVPQHDRLRGDNVIVTLGSLNPIDKRFLAKARREFSQMVNLPSPRTAVLLGGPTRAVSWDRAQWQTLIHALGEWVRGKSGSLLITSSARTPVASRLALRDAFSSVQTLQWHGRDDGPNPYAGMLAWADRIVVSADSVNMVSEACSTGVPVVVAFTAAPSSRIARFHAALAERGLTRLLSQGLESYAYTPLREAATVAGMLRERGLY